jgi:hypothetical protein
VDPARRNGFRTHWSVAGRRQRIRPGLQPPSGSIKVLNVRKEVLVMPTVLRSGPHRVYFYSHDLNEPPHVHVDQDDRSAKFWLNPIGLARNLGFKPKELRVIDRLLVENEAIDEDLSSEGFLRGAPAPRQPIRA